MAQRLVRRLCAQCKKPKTINAKDLTSIGLSYVANKKKTAAPTGKIKIFEANGCKECMNTGYRGRMGVYEFMPLTAKLRELVLARVSLDELKNEAIHEGMITLRNAALRQVIAGVTSLDEAMRIT